MTRGGLTVFLSANDVAKCFALRARDVGARSGAADNGRPSGCPRGPKGASRRRSQGIHARKQRDFLMNSLRSVLLAASVLAAATCSDSFGLASAASNPDSLTMTCAQVRDHIKKHGQTLLATGKEAGNYSFDYAECGGTVPGYACTTDEAYCYVGWWCDYNYPAQVNSQMHDQGTESCPARK
jgi:hypothetical protein